MKEGVFRKTSLERLSSPEQLDQLMTVATPKAWLALLAIAAIVITSIFWGVFGSIPSKTYGQGILIKSGGVHNIIHVKAGQITDVRVRQGDLVKKGDVVARIENYEVVEQIHQLKKELEELEKIQEKLPNFNREKFQAELYELYELTRSIEEARATLHIHEANYNKELAVADTSNLELKNATIDLEEVKINVRAARSNVDRIEALYEAGAVSETELENAKIDLALKEVEVEKIERLIEILPVREKQILESLNTHRAQMEQSRLNIRLLQEELKDREAKLSSTNTIKIVDINKQIDALQKELEFSSNIIAHLNGRILEVRVNKGDIIQPGATLFSIVQEGEDIQDIEGILYVPAGEGKKILPGMEAQVSPTIVKKEEYGYMMGRVVSVSEYPATAQGMIRTLGNQELVAQLAGNNAPIEVRIELILDSNTTSGYKWSTPQGPPIKIDSGTLCTGSITVSKQKPIRMIIPKIKKYLPFD